MEKVERAIKATAIVLGFVAAAAVAAILVVLAKTAKDVLLLVAALLAPFAVLGLAWFGVYKALGFEG